ncbi:MAG: hypothetical protein LLG45_02490 [Actinomycetia bacterium]|nr:hypothetical protein [Actinomycetes bacterium]
MDAKLERFPGSQHAAVLAEDGDCGYLSWGCLWCAHGVDKDSSNYEYLLTFLSRHSPAEKPPYAVDALLAVVVCLP